MHPKPDHGEESYRGKGLLVGKVALITGGDSGIGRVVAIDYAREDAEVAISYLPDEESDAQDVAVWVRKAGRRVTMILSRKWRDTRELPPIGTMHKSAIIFNVVSFVLRRRTSSAVVRPSAPSATTGSRRAA